MKTKGTKLTRKPGQPAHLTMDAVLTAGVNLLDTTETLGVRQLAAALGVMPNAITNRFPERYDQLVRDVVRFGMNGSIPDWMAEDPWEKNAAVLFAALRTHLSGRRALALQFAAKIAEDVGFVPALEHYVSRIVQGAGVGRRQTPFAVRFVMAQLIGFVMTEMLAPELPSIAVPRDPLLRSVTFAVSLERGLEKICSMLVVRRTTKTRPG